jgi:hypothetical protein
MRRSTVLTLGIALVLALIAAGSIEIFAGEGAAAAAEEENSAASVEPVTGSDLSRIRLSKLAANRIGLRTDTVRSAKAVNGGSAVKAVPYTALLYDDHGETWVYVSQKPLLFVRAPVQVAFIDGTRVVLSKGPEVGTPVATVGAAELFGTEFEVTDD